MGLEMLLFLTLFLVAHVLIYVFRGSLARSFVHFHNKNAERIKLGKYEFGNVDLADAIRALAWTGLINGGCSIVLISVILIFG